MLLEVSTLADPNGVKKHSLPMAWTRKPSNDDRNILRFDFLIDVGYSGRIVHQRKGLLDSSNDLDGELFKVTGPAIVGIALGGGLIMLLSTFAILYFHHKERRGSKRKDIESAILKGNKEILRRHTNKQLEESTRGSRHFPAPPSSAQVDRRNNVAQLERKWDNMNPPDVSPPRRGARDNNGRIGSLRLDVGFYVTMVPSPRPGLPPSATSHSSAFSAARTSSDIGVLPLFSPRAQSPTNGSRSRSAVETEIIQL